MLKEERNKGITLIALIITIIVLLILAGVTISAITGNESVMEKAKDAKEKTDISNEREEIQLSIVSILAKTEALSITDETELLNTISDKVTSITKHENHWDIIGNTGKEYILTENGKVLTQEDLDSGIDMQPVFIKRWDNEGRINFRYEGIISNNDIINKEWGFLTYRGSQSYDDGLTLEKASIDSDIYVTQYNLAAVLFQFRIRDIGTGGIARPYMKYEYDGHDFIKYGEQIHVYYDDLPPLE